MDLKNNIQEALQAFQGRGLKESAVALLGISGVKPSITHIVSSGSNLQ